MSRNVTIELDRFDAKLVVTALDARGHIGLAKRIESQLPKPKPDAPDGAGAVAKTRNGDIYIRATGGGYHEPDCNDWWLARGGAFVTDVGPRRNGRHSWSDLDVVEVLSQGVPGVGG